ncbi:MAG: ABC transporter substrate-binding protein [Peptococcaceae bacterium]|nr:ABC transporter substrate-binding protein [Peptococcaceae bacterium]
MTLKKLIALLLMVVMVALVGCASDKKEANSAAFTFTDMTSREIKLDGPVTRIVALTPSDCEILYAIGAGDAVVGRSTYCDYPGDVLNKTEVASGADTNIEEIIALEPQVVLMSTMAQTEEQVAVLEEAGITCVVSETRNISGVYTAIEMIGKVVGKETEASALIEDMKATFAKVEQKAKQKAEQDPTGGGKTIYFEVSSLQWGDPWTAGKGTFMDELAMMLGLTNIFADVDGWGMISQEQVIERNPAYIVTIEMYGGDGPKPDEEVMKREGWQGITAIRNGTVLNADNNEMSRPGPRLINAAVALYDFIYNADETNPLD